jgi:hypothetical protein
MTDLSICVFGDDDGEARGAVLQRRPAFQPAAQSASSPLATSSGGVRAAHLVASRARRSIGVSIGLATSFHSHPGIRPPGTTPAVRQAPWVAGMGGSLPPCHAFLGNAISGAHHG